MKCPLCSSARPEREFLITLDLRRYWCCVICNLIWLHEGQRPSREVEEARYRTHQNDGKEYLSYLAKTAFPIAELLAPRALGLDYGCGPTEGMRALLSPLGFNVESYDPIFFAREHLLNNRYDFLLCSEAAEHFFFPAQEFERIDGLLKEGGVLGVSSRLAVPREEFDAWSYRRDPTHVVFYQAETVRWIARRFGWELLRLESPLWILRKGAGTP